MLSRAGLSLPWGGTCSLSMLTRCMCVTQQMLRKVRPSRATNQPRRVPSPGMRIFRRSWSCLWRRSRLGALHSASKSCRRLLAPKPFRRSSFKISLRIYLPRHTHFRCTLYFSHAFLHVIFNLIVSLKSPVRNCLCRRM